MGVLYQQESVKLIAAPFFRRYLPHWRPLEVPFFLTYRLAGTLPRSVIDNLERERQRLQMLDDEYSEDERNLRIDKKLFAIWDKYLDRNINIKWLSDPRIANIVRDNLYYHSGRKYSLWAYVIMPNHVHVLLQPDRDWLKQFGVHENSTTCCQLVKKTGSRYKKGPLSAILHSLRSYTANEANKVLGRKGAFWRSEVYDHWVRDNAEFQRIIYYIENNPAKAGLVKNPEDWRFSSAYDRFQRKLGPFERLA